MYIEYGHKNTDDTHLRIVLKIAEFRSNGELFIRKDTNEKLEESPKMVIHTIQPHTLPLDKDKQISLSSIKEMTGSDNFVSLPFDKKACSVEDLNSCRKSQYIENQELACNCLPYGFEQATFQYNTTKKVRKTDI